MSHALVTEVLDHAPAELTTLERLILVVIAEAAQDEDRPGVPAREAWPSMETLSKRTGMPPRTVRAAMRRLAERGLDVRVRQGTDKRGAPVYAHYGHATQYRVPRLRGLREGGTGQPPLVGEGGTGQPPLTPERGLPSDQEEALERPEGGCPVPPNQKEPEGTTPQPPAVASPAPSAGSGGGGGGDPRRPAVERAARDRGVDEDVLAAYVERVLADPTTEHSIPGRIARDPSWHERHLAAARGQQDRTRKTRDRLAKAHEHLGELEAAGDLGRRTLADERRDMDVPDGVPDADLPPQVLMDAVIELRNRQRAQRATTRAVPA